MMYQCRYFSGFPLRSLISAASRPRLSLSPSLNSPYQPPSALLCSMISAGLTCHGQKGTRYRVIRPLRTKSHGKPPHIWPAVDDSDAAIQYILKLPPQDEENNASALTAFKHELDMLRLFQNELMIRTLVDYILDSETGGPMMVLETFPDSLWEVRNARPFTAAEIKWVMKGVLLGLLTVHMKGLVYTDLKMENVVVGGFDHSGPNEHVRNIIVRLADCGAISKPSTTGREITPLTYRSPEVHFGKSWDQSTDIWSWGIILAQLLQAQHDHKAPGMYDKINTGTLQEKTKAIRDKLAIDFDLASQPFFAEHELLPPPQPEQAYMWANTMFETGVSGPDIQFLAQVLNPDPGGRLSVREILDSGYLDVEIEEAQAQSA